MAKALLIGINYIGSRHELKGCINDVMNTKAMLLSKGYLETEITVLTDDSCSTIMPTRENITNALLELVNSKANRLFLHYAGHGCQIRDLNDDEEDGFDECIMPSDYKLAGGVIDDELKDIIMLLRPDQHLTAIMDCCHSGTVLDLRYNLYSKISGGGLAMVQTRKIPATSGSCVMISGCQDNQSSADTYLEGKSQGAMSYAFIKCLPKSKNYGELIYNMRKFLKSKNYIQIPNLSSGKKIELSHKIHI